MEEIDTTFEVNDNIEPMTPVVVVEQMNFRPVDEHQEERRPPLKTWWPMTARILIDGLFGTDDARRAAVRAILPVCDIYTRSTPMDVRMMTPDMRLIHNIYSAKLVSDERELRDEVDKWIKRVTVFFDDAHAVVEKRAKALAELHSSAQTLCERYDDAEAQTIIQERLKTYKQQLTEASDLELRVLRADAKTTCDDGPIQTSDDNARLKEALQTSTVAQEVLDMLGSIYGAHCKNVEADYAVRIQNACHRWLPGLKLSQP